MWRKRVRRKKVREKESNGMKPNQTNNIVSKYSVQQTNQQEKLRTKTECIQHTNTWREIYAIA